MVTGNHPTDQYDYGGPHELEWQPYDGTPLPRMPIVSRHKLTDDYRQDAYSRRPGVPRRRPKPSLGSSMRWYPSQSTNRVLQSQLFIPDPAVHQRASELQDIKQNHQRLKVQIYQRHDDMPPPSASSCKSAGGGSGNALRWRLCPWTAPVGSQTSAVVGSLTPVQRAALRDRSDTAGHGDPRAGFGFDCTEPEPIVPLSASQPIYANHRLPPLPPSPTSPTSPSLSRTASPTISRNALLPTTVTPSEGMHSIHTKKTVEKERDLMSQYDLYHAQAVADGTKLISDATVFNKDGKHKVTGYDVFALDFRDTWNLEHPELADKQPELKKEWDLPVSEELLHSRRMRISAAAQEEWAGMDKDVKLDFNMRADVLNQPPAPSVEQLINSSNFSWEELNQAHDWYNSKECRDQFRAQRMELSNLETELNGVRLMAKNAECSVVDDFNPESDEPVTGRPERPDTATDTETEQASNLKDDIDDLNQVLKQRREPNKSAERGVSSVFMGADSQPETMKAKKLGRGRRTSLSITDLQWKSMSSLDQAGVKKGLKLRRKKSVSTSIQREMGLSPKTGDPAPLSPTKEDEEK